MIGELDAAEEPPALAEERRTLPVCAITLVAGWKIVPETGGGSSVRLDLGGAALISLALAAIVVPLSKGREQGWPGWVFAVLASVPSLVGAFVWYEDRLSRAGGMPLVDLRLLRITSCASITALTSALWLS